MQVYRYAGVQVCRYTGIPVYRYAGILVYSYTGTRSSMLVCRYTDRYYWYNGILVYTGNTGTRILVYGYTGIRVDR